MYEFRKPIFSHVYPLRVQVDHPGSLERVREEEKKRDSERERERERECMLANCA
jgi:hypothetical protein